MSSSPFGTVTFLFTDIEGSTKLAQAYPDQWESLRERHHSILRAAVEAYNGYVFQVIGDAFCVSFHNVRNGLCAAIDAQQKLASEDWGKTPVRVRMGLHTGSAEIHGNDYRGYLTMAKVQRIMSVAYGGQVLLSNASAELLHQELPEGITLRDMQEHRLKGLPVPERLWQLVAPDLQQDFPPLQSLKEIPNNVPVQLTSFIGREKEVEQVKNRLANNRLVTLTGSGGIGKTRLSIQVASELLDEYPNGVWLVELAPVTDPALVTQTVCTTLDIKPQGKIPALNILTDYLRSKKVLLVIDNCEHLINACAQLSETLLHTCHSLRILASSREALGIEGESAYRVPSLSLADSNSGFRIIEQSESTQLFVERAKTILPGYALTEANARTIAQICQQLDGIALAIELAASRVKILKVEQIKERLEDAFRLLTGGSRTALPRQQTLRGTVDWSYNLLSEEERTVLRCLSVFVGGWTLEATESVCDTENMLDLLSRLVDKSLVAVDREHINEPRYYLLETIRQYAREKLAESSDGEQVRARHLDYFLKLAQRAEPNLKGGEQFEWLDRLELEHDNLRAAWKWAIESDQESALTLASALLEFWFMRGNPGEGREWLSKLLALTSQEQSTKHAHVLAIAGRIALDQQDFGVARGLLEQALAIARKSGDKKEIAFALQWLGWTLTLSQHDDPLAQSFIEECLAISEELQDQWDIALAIFNLGILATNKGHHVEAEEYCMKSLAKLQELGDSINAAYVLNQLGELARIQGDYERAARYYEENIKTRQEQRNLVGLASPICNLAWVAVHEGDHQKAKALFEESMRLYDEFGSKIGVINCLAGFATLLGMAGKLEHAASLFGAVGSLLEKVRISMFPADQNEIDHYVAVARSQLDEVTFAKAWATARLMLMEQAIAYALAETTSL